MNRIAINFLNMLQSVVKFFADNLLFISNKPALLNAVEKLKVFVREIKELEMIQSEKGKIEVALKQDTRTSLIKALMKVLEGIGAHAAATNDLSLKMFADLTEYDLKKMRDHKLLITARSIYETATKIAENLKIWEVTLEDIEATNTYSDEYDAKDPAIRIIKGRSSQATTDIKEKIDEAKHYLKDTVDPMMKPFKESNALLYNHYLKVRTIINIAGGHSKDKTDDKDKTTK
jgi:cupin superfamily acireductone dioxygenase involved in methionine salvage